MLRQSRQAKILEIISHKEVETQDELCSELNNAGFIVTQATVSRDIRDMHLFKVAGMTKRYRYAYVREAEGEVSKKMRNLFRECVLSIKVAQNMIVLKTIPANGSNAGAIVDKLAIASIVGTIAGDDTLLVICDNNEDALEAEKQIREFLSL